ncbi:MAG: agmatinase [Polyangia bacterium]
MNRAPTNLGIVALPFEVSTSFGKGTMHAPDTVLEELDALDCFDFRTARDPFHGVPRSVVRPHGSELVDARIQQAVAGRVVGEMMDGGGFPLSIGGEHTVSLGPIRAARARGELGVVQLDAHADLRDSYDGNPLSHACTMRRVLDMDCDVFGVGIRAVSQEEATLAQEHGIEHVHARRVIEDTDWYRLLSDLPQRIYLTVDLDYFDPADVPAVGTPEPGGPDWESTLAFLEYLFAVKDVVGADVVELMPGAGDAASVRAAARLIGSIVGLRFPEAG